MLGSSVQVININISNVLLGSVHLSTHGGQKCFEDFPKKKQRHWSFASHSSSIWDLSDPKRQTFLISRVPETLWWQQQKTDNIDCLVLSSGFNLLNFLQHRFVETSEFSWNFWVTSTQYLPSRDSYLLGRVRHFVFSTSRIRFLGSSDVSGLFGMAGNKTLGPESVSNVCSVALFNISFTWEQLKMAVAVNQEGHILGRHEHH